MGTIANANGRNFITVAAGRLGGLGVTIGRQMSLSIDNPKIPAYKSTTSLAIFDSAN
jgi:hypothetical protein